MPLTIGSALGAYEILGTLGAGGMGEVYRARDTRPKREVAVKVLPDAFAGDPDRLAVDAQPGADLQFSAPHTLFTILGMQSYFDVMPGGQEFLIGTIEAAGSAGGAPITILTGWPALLRK